MTVANAFTIGLSYAKAAPLAAAAEPKKKTKNYTRYCVLVDSGAVLNRVTRVLASLGGMTCPQTTFNFAGRDRTAIEVPLSVVEQLKQDGEDFIVFDRINALHTWQICRKHSRGDIKAQVGSDITRLVTSVRPGRTRSR